MRSIFTLSLLYGSFFSASWITQLVHAQSNPAKQEQAYPQSIWEDVFSKKRESLAENMEPVLAHPEDQQQAANKLQTLADKFKKKPNILIFIMDDVGYGDPGCFGGGVAIGAPTPNMDKLCHEGLQLTSTYSQPSCSPTRATLLTGRLPMRHGILIPPMYGAPGGLAEEQTIAKLLSEAGYRTQGIGKWHVGENEASQPQNVGFDDFYGFLSVSDMYTEWRDPALAPELVNNKERTEALINPSKDSPFNKHLVHGVKGAKLENIEELTIANISTFDQKMADYGVKFIQDNAKKEQPFFLYYGTRGGHFDNYPNESVKGKSPAKYPYKDVMVEMDAILGRLVKTLEETGQLENTFIFVTSDNGPEMESWPDSGYTPFRGSKGSSFEGGVRVPGIAYWKGVIQPGRVSDGLFDLSDLFTTSLSLAGAKEKLPKDRYIDGIDQVSFLLADQGKSNRASILYWLQDRFSAVRMGEYKIMETATVGTLDTPDMGGLTGKNVDYTYGHLFNLYLDPKESHNIIIRKIPFAEYLTHEIDRHMETFKKYPSKIQVKAHSSPTNDR
ncbi:arylsulfatase [Candidatus Protochlamydia naegleriophila]|uniref:Arylsulfatase n=1 Tax=Candidatus Protochlamydia naegleriophila TaxID=389348 RepID=A0A0U5JHH5_9BACT|nr:arylsulfatase [Candidatus Protochlamydia naegleriophila]CUI17254.1 arylsulfatase [Candidatus Protochlamydia naegleriophila]